MASHTTRIILGFTSGSDGAKLARFGDHKWQDHQDKIRQGKLSEKDYQLLQAALHKNKTKYVSGVVSFGKEDREKLNRGQIIKATHILNSTFDELAASNPKIKDILTKNPVSGVYFSDKILKGRNVDGSYMTDGSTSSIVLSTRAFLGKKGINKPISGANTTGRDSQKVVMRHEIAHHIRGNLTKTESKKIDDFYKKNTASVSKISKYAKTNASEFFSEAFAVKFSGGKLPQPVNKLFNELGL